jgi:hypothetical protein
MRLGSDGCNKPRATARSATLLEICYVASSRVHGVGATRVLLLPRTQNTSDTAGISLKYR